ncbi:MAG: fibronectin type III domain-containing protein [Desulfobacteraceae bacterium]|jgi:hypothetical protein
MQPIFALPDTHIANHSEHYFFKNLSDLNSCSLKSTCQVDIPLSPHLCNISPKEINSAAVNQNTQIKVKKNKPFLCVINRFFWIINIIILLLIIISTSEANAASVTLEWDPVSQSIDGYRIYMRIDGQRYDYKNPTWEGTTTACTINDLKNGTTYYFVVRAFKGEEESKDSKEVPYYAPIVFSPIAKAGNDQIVLSSTTVTLDGTASTDPDDTDLTFKWSQSAGSKVALTDSDRAKSFFNAPDFSGPTILTFQLKVMDPGKLSATDTCQITVYPAGSADSDQDGLTNVDEITIHGTNPGSSDTDGDGIEDAEEIKAGTDPNAPPVIKIWIEAEEGNIHYPMQISDNNSASANGFIEVENNSLDSGGYALYTFNVQNAAEYIIWGRVIANNLTSDSFFVSIDNDPEFTWHTIHGGHNAWKWDVISQRKVADHRDTSNPLIYNFTTGTHTLTIKQRENGTKLDKILITNDKSFVPLGANDQTEQTIEKIWMEAEEGILQSPMQIDSDSQASAEKYVSVPNENANAFDPTLATGQAKYNFEVSNAGNYLVWGRVVSSSITSDSFHVSIDDKDVLAWHTKIDQKGDWIWDVVSKRKFGDKRDNSNPLLYYLGKGPHTLTIKHRESGTKIDKILITNDITFLPQ